MTYEEREMVEQFRAAFPHTEDYYCAVGFFRACGLAEGQAHALAESIAYQERSHPMRTFVFGILVGSLLTSTLTGAGQFYNSSGSPSAPSGSVQQFDYFRQRQQYLDLNAIRRNSDQQRQQQLLHPCGR